jgi:hypothetical protein
VRIGLQFWLVEFCSNSSNINFCLDRSGEPSQLLRLISQFWWDVHIRSLTAGIAVAGSTTNDKPKMGVTKWLRFYIIYVFADNVWKSGNLVPCNRTEEIGFWGAGADGKTSGLNHCGWTRISTTHQSDSILIKTPVTGVVKHRYYRAPAGTGWSITLQPMVLPLEDPPVISVAGGGSYRAYTKKWCERLSFGRQEAQLMARWLQSKSDDPDIARSL